MSDSLAFLLKDVSQLMRRRFDERARLIGVTRDQWRALFVVSRNEGANQGVLADMLEVEPITMCRMIDRLEDAEMVERRRDPADRRAWQIFLTPKATPLIDRLHGIGEAMIEDSLEGISPERCAALIETLEQIRDNLNAIPRAKEANHG